MFSTERAPGFVRVPPRSRSDLARLAISAALEEGKPLRFFGGWEQVPKPTFYSEWGFDFRSHIHDEPFKKYLDKRGIDYEERVTGVGPPKIFYEVPESTASDPAAMLELIKQLSGFYMKVGEIRRQERAGMKIEGASIRPKKKGRRRA